MRVLVVGAGIAGLVAAWRLRHHGIECTVYERSPVPTVSGSGLGLWDYAVRALRQSGLDVSDTGVSYTHVRLTSHKGRRLVTCRAPGLSVHRGDLYRKLVDSVPPGCIEWGAAVRTVDTDRAELMLDDGRRIQGDVVLAADGLHSTVRSALKLPGDALRYQGYTAWRGMLQVAVGPADAIEMWGPGVRFGRFLVGGSRTAWWATANRAAGASEASPLAVLQDFHPNVRRMVSATPPHDILRTDLYDRDAISTWVFGRTALLGDAAHPTSPNLGQGACLAILDGLCVADALAEAEDPVLALHRYMARRQRHAYRIVRLSRMVGWLAQWSHPWTASVRNLAFRMLPRTVTHGFVRAATRGSEGD